MMLLIQHSGKGQAMRVESRSAVARVWVLVERSTVNRNPDSIWEEKTGTILVGTVAVNHRLFICRKAIRLYLAKSERAGCKLHFEKSSNMSGEGDSRRKAD